MTNIVFPGQRSTAKANACGTCRLATQCLPGSLQGVGSEMFERIAQQTRLLEKGALLHEAESPFNSLYVVQIGALKGLSRDGSGTEHIARFYLPGEIVGLDSMDRDRSSLTVVALETTALCRIPYGVFHNLALTQPPIMHWLLRRVSAEVVHERTTRMALACGNASQVLAHALNDLGERFASGGLSGTRLRLPMSRCELGNYLGLAPETMSRLFQRFRRQRLVSAVRREIELLDIHGLRRLAAGGQTPVRQGHKTTVPTPDQDPRPMHAANRV